MKIESQSKQSVKKTELKISFHISYGLAKYASCILRLLGQWERSGEPQNAARGRECVKGDLYLTDHIFFKEENN